MKTPREILLERHQSAQPRLDAIRRAALATLAREENAPASAAVARTNAALDSGLRQSAWPTWCEWMRSIRWQLAGLGAAWALIALFNLSASEALSSSRAEVKVLSGRQLLLVLRENRQHLRQLIESPNDPASPPNTSIPAPRSQNRSTLGLPS